MIRYAGLLVVMLAGVSSAAGQTALLLKTGDARRARSAAPRTPKRLDASRWHGVAEFAAPPDAQALGKLTARGIRAVGYVPKNGLFISVRENTPLDNIGIIWSGTLDTTLKISPLLTGRGAEKLVNDFIVEVFSDVSSGDARTIALLEGFTLQDNPDLLAGHILVHGQRRFLRQLAEWDEVAYIFPASDALKRGIPSGGCAGAYTSAGVINQSVPLIGDGWDGPGLGSASLTYSFTRVTDALPADAVKGEIARALEVWSKYVRVAFSAGSGDGLRNVAVLFASGDHGDGYPFDGRGGVLAHTFYPWPVNPEPIAGNMHFDKDENWQIDTDTDLFSVALHEAGHALGLGHSDNPDDVMYPYYRRVSGLSPGDIGAIRLLYAAQPDNSSPVTPGTPSGGNPGTPGTVNPAAPGTPVTPAPPTPSTPVTPVTPSTPVTPVTPTPVAPGTPSAPVAPGTPSTGSPGQPAAQSPLILIVQAPATPTMAPAIAISGTISGGSGGGAIQWTSTGGSTGTAVASAQWSIPSVPLNVGANAITILATDSQVHEASGVVYVTRVSGPDTAAPSLRITFPASTNVGTLASTIDVSGTASDNLQSVTWTSSLGDSGTASGLANWAITGIRLMVGANTIVVTATDMSGNTAWRSLIVTRMTN